MHKYYFTTVYLRCLKNDRDNNKGNVGDNNSDKKESNNEKESDNEKERDNEKDNDNLRRYQLKFDSWKPTVLVL